MNGQGQAQRFSRLGMLWGFVLGLVIGTIGVGPYFHDWPASTSLAAILAVGASFGLVGYFFIPILMGQIAGGSSPCAGGAVEDDSSVRQRQERRERFDGGEGAPDTDDWSD